MSENSFAKALSSQEITEMKQSNVLLEAELFSPTRLQILTISYYDFSGKSHADGKIVVLDAAAPYVLSAFKSLYEKKFPIAQMKLMNEFRGSDELAMASNNTSALNQRKITGGQRLSIHSYGLAIDVNPIQNPFKNSEGVQPKAGEKFLNRSEKFPGRAEEIVKIFYENGFNIWGGNWQDPIDYQHFQTSRALAELLVEMDAADAKKFFELHVKFLQNHSEELLSHLNAADYKKDRKRFFAEAKKLK